LTLTSFIAMPLGNALAGPLSDAYGINPVLVVCGFVLLGSGAAPLLVRGSRRLTRGEHLVAVPQQVGHPDQ
jgi:MFS family permease